MLYGGTEVREGTGTMLVIAVGINTENGRIVNLLTGGTVKRRNKEKQDEEKRNGTEGESIELEEKKSFKKAINLKQKWEDRKEKKRKGTYYKFRGFYEIPERI